MKSLDFAKASVSHRLDQKGLICLIVFSLFLLVGAVSCSSSPTSVPPVAPTVAPTKAPVVAPTTAPTTVPVSVATKAPAVAPTSAPTVAASAQGTITLDFSIPLSAGMEPGFKALIKEYEAKNPNIKINLITTPFAQYSSVLKVMYASRDQADVVLAATTDAPFYAKNQALVTLDDIVPPNTYDQYTPATIGGAIVGGKVYVQPWRDSSHALYYNKEYFELAGIKPPTGLDDAWTWPQWKENITKVVAAAEKKTGSKVWGLVFLENPLASGADSWLWPLIRSAGPKGSPTYNAMSPDGMKIKGYLDTPEALKAFQFFSDLYNKDKLAPQSEVQDAFGTGKAATFLAFLPTGDTLTKNFPNLKWGTFPEPYFVTPVAQGGANGFGIPARAKHPKEAKDFVKYLASEEATVLYFKTAGVFTPARKAMLTNYPDYFRVDWQKTFVDSSIRWGVPYPSTPCGTITASIMSQGFKNIALGTPVEATVQQMVSDIDEQCSK